jgi:transcriptional regulator with XRE-family HTH domain
MTNQQLLAKTLVDLRKKAGISQTDLARGTKLNRSYISFIERGQRNPTVIVLIRLCEELDVKPSKVLAMIGQ